MRNPIVISVINHKGGVSKTTSCLNIAAGLVKLGKKALIIDLDTQMNLTHSLIDDLGEHDNNITEAVLGDVPLKEIIRKTKIEGLDIAPSGESMINLDLRLQSAFSRESKLRNILKGDQPLDYDFILIDNGPHIGLSTINSLIASDYYLVPVSAEYLPMVGIKYLLKTIDVVKGGNPYIRNAGYLLTMVNKRESIANDVEQILRETFPEQVFKSVVRINTKLKACPQKKQTIFEAESSKGKSHSDYMNVAKELLQRLGCT